MEDGRTKALELSWSPIVGEGDVVEKLMVCVRDVTELKRLANEASTQKRELEMIGEILSVSQEKFQDFMQTSMAFVDENRTLTEQASGPTAELITQLFRNMHTVKGNARTYGLGNLTNTVHEAEQSYDDLRKGTTTEWEPKTLLEPAGPGARPAGRIRQDQRHQARVARARAGAATSRSS